MVNRDGMPEISSDIFRMKRSMFARLIIFNNAKWALILFPLLVLSGIIIGIKYDLRWLILSLMLVFIVIPGIFAMLYYYYGLKKGYYINIIDHSIECVDSGIVARMFYGESEIRKELIPYDVFSKYVVGRDYVLFKTKGEWDGFFWLPISAFASTDVFSQIINWISSYNNQL